MAGNPNHYHYIQFCPTEQPRKQADNFKHVRSNQVGLYLRDRIVRLWGVFWGGHWDNHKSGLRMGHIPAQKGGACTQQRGTKDGTRPTSHPAHLWWARIDFYGHLYSLVVNCRFLASMLHHNKSPWWSHPRKWVRGKRDICAATRNTSFRCLHWTSNNNCYTRRKMATTNILWAYSLSIQVLTQTNLQAYSIRIFVCKHHYQFLLMKAAIVFLICPIDVF